MIRLSPSQSSVEFPSSSANPSHWHAHLHVRPPHLPFRRISLPTPPVFPQRLSVVSVASFDSLPEEDGDSEAADVSPTSLTPNPRPHKSSLLSSSVSLLPVSTNRPRRRSIEPPQSRRHKGRRAKDSSEAADGSITSNVKIESRAIKEAREKKRTKIIREFYDTEKTYVDGLDFIYHHFLSPLIASLEGSEPLLDRAALTSLFSNFIDIWNLHKAFFEAMTAHLSPMLMPANVPLTTHPTTPPPPLSSILLSHFPYLSLYNPFITAFPSILSTLASLTTPPSFSHPNPSYSKPFSEFLAKQESQPQCGKLKFRDWMLTIVQRCPRYLLLLKDLRGCTEPTGDDENDGGEYERLGRVLDLVAKITSSLNTSLQTHAQTLSLISLQRSTANLPLSPPFQFVLPGRKLFKRGPLYQIERSEPPKEREFLLFSDCLVWLARKKGSGELEGEWGWGRGRISSRAIGSSESVVDANANTKPVYGNRNRSMSEAHLPLGVGGWKNDGGGLRSTPSSPRGMRFPLLSKASQVPVPAFAAKPKRHSMAGIPVTASGGSGTGGRSADERWVYKGRLDLVDVEVVVTSEWGGEQRRFEVLSPEGSFALYAGTEHDRDEWVSTIRQAKAQILVSLNVTNPNSTLTSSTSTHHVRRSLQALPFPPAASSVSLVDGKIPDHESTNSGVASTLATVENGRSRRRGKVEHWVPAIWIPDEKTRECMRCGQTFSWRRRRHHCRLCGRCVCGGCSEKTFYITDAGDKKDGSSKPARACNVCYETVFPVLDLEPEFDARDPNDSGVNPNSNSEAKPDSIDDAHNWDTITSLSNFTAWLSTPSFSVQTSSADSTPSSPRALMGMDFERATGARPGEHPFVEGKKGRVRLRSLTGNSNSGPRPRPLSSLHMVEGFDELDADTAARGTGDQSSGRSGQSQSQGNRGQPLDSPPPSGASVSSGVDKGPTPQQPQHPSVKPAESTVKRKKRFSLPAIALQPLNVTARTAPMGLRSDVSEGSSSGSAAANGAKERERTRRFSLVLGGRYQSRSSLSLALGDNERRTGDTDMKASGSGAGTGEKSIVMTKLSELLKSSSPRARTG